ncbi:MULTISPECIES: MFS transporter [Brenneria]|uniref:MFS transporter n=1 Tax=Brenneria nigrifluens DSM 30175 = ATCC 13028 TaxID=1121120 RepID=A0A2U1USB6_9GAMM|nr:MULTISPECIES: MFS transporter [Brenneria]EHD21134.1 major facilitator superfamily MFS_1 [Brenneria sp. EniD312]PWC24553.1 MFS transporter [Brenneria nigrifluens] [Brenneria nigrifluens DSM 30175 = ATCC 13028]QCR04284.1 MFS transporter [Brenneria nigrifluens] [Brenneria nigrifluens DSM 30175 = ATCC 13028]
MTCLTTPTSSRRGAILLPLLVPGIAQALIALDYAIMFVALPELSRALRLSPAMTPWIVSLYGLTFAGLLLTGGWLSDRFGARCSFRLAMGLFLLASVCGALAQESAMLLLARAGQGAAAAVMQPAVLALLRQRFQGDAYNRALAVWSATGAAGLVAGVFLGGVLTHIEWRLIFWVNLPPGLLTLWLVQRHFAAVPAPRQPQSLSLGALLGSAAVAGVVWSLTRLAETGAADYLANRLSAALVLAFILHETFARRPLLHPALRALTTLRIGCIASACYMASVGSQFYVMTLLWQRYYQLDVLTTGMLFLPLALLIVVGNLLFARLAKGRDARRLLLWGFIGAAFGLGLLAYAALQPFSASFIAAIVASGIGHGIIYPAMFQLGLRDVPQEYQGAAGALMVTSQYTAGALALALLSLLLGNGAGAESWSKALWLLTGAAALGAAIVAAYETERR